jgi:hypothetical protein
MAEIAFEANNEPARSVLMRLIAAASPGQSGRAYWLQRCDPLPSAWCFINLAYTNRAAVAQGNRPTGTMQPDASIDRSRWFNATPGKP